MMRSKKEAAELPAMQSLSSSGRLFCLKSSYLTVILSVTPHGQ
jgi:hypothetical protein